MSRSFRNPAPVATDESPVLRQSAHDLLDELLDQLMEHGFFGTGTLELASQNGRPCKCQADVRRKLRPRNRQYAMK